MSPTFLNKPETGRLSPSSSSSADMKEGAVITKSSLGAPTSPPSASNSSPASILKEERALERTKSLKRVSFEEEPDIIDDSRESTVEVTVVVGEEDEDIPALEEVEQKPLGGFSDAEPALVRPQTPPGERYECISEISKPHFVDQMLICFLRHRLQRSCARILRPIFPAFRDSGHFLPRLPIITAATPASCQNSPHPNIWVEILFLSRASLPSY